MDTFDRQLDDLLNPEAQTGAKIGWRSWYVYQMGTMVRLASLKSGHRSEAIWTPGEWQEAECAQVTKLMDKHGVDYRTAEVAVHKTPGLRLPVEGCKCGFYSALDRDHLVSLGYNRYQAVTTVQEMDNARMGVRVIGTVENVGKVIPGRQGWRAEMVRPASLEVPYEYWKLVKPLEEAYQIPVTLANTYQGGAE